MSGGPRLRTNRPQPKDRLDPERQAQWDELWAEFRRVYLAAPVGQDHRKAYSLLRQTARRNYDEIAALAARGQEITEAVIWKLLPYTDSPYHRSRGAWTHLAPAITGDLRAWHQAAGWAQPESWPALAQAIWRFVVRTVEQPEELAAACAGFAALPYTKGFQTGMLTPILNALRPDRYLLFNSKSRTVLNYFTGAGHSQALLDYPAANAALWALVAGQAALQQEAVTLEMEAGDLFDMFCHWLVGIRRFAFRPVRYWRMALEDEPGLWAEWREGRYVALGWEELGDLAMLTRAEFERQRDSLLAQYPQRAKAGAQAVWRLARQMGEGDRVVVVDRSGLVLGIGTVAGPYYFVPELELGQRRPVEWDDLTPRQAAPGSPRPLVEIERPAFEEMIRAPVAPPPAAPIDIAAGAPAHVNESPAPYRAPRIATQPPYSLAGCAADTGLDEALLARWIAAIERKGQAILYGPPGTGKTYVAQRLAQHLVGPGPVAGSENAGDGFVEVVQFHPAYTYEDFVQGIRPQTGASGLSYQMTPGHFLSFCRRAVGRRGRCVLIIDEINRANLAQVFGELMYLLEYREATVALAGDGAPFAIPANVRLIGTMNTADRSLALVDHALRRRFAFLALYPDLEALRRYHARIGSRFPVEALAGLLARLNAAIGDRNYALGITYFLRPNLEQELESIWQMEVEPYLEELFFDQPEQVEPFRWAAIRGELGL